MTDTIPIANVAEIVEIAMTAYKQRIAELEAELANARDLLCECCPDVRNGLLQQRVRDFLNPTAPPQPGEPS